VSDGCWSSSGIGAASDGEIVGDGKRKLLIALAWMCEQYLGRGKLSDLDHQGMSAGEDAISLLAKYGLVELTGRGGNWTKAGRELLDSN